MPGPLAGSSYSESSSRPAVYDRKGFKDVSSQLRDRLRSFAPLDQAGIQNLIGPRPEYDSNLINRLRENAELGGFDSPYTIYSPEQRQALMNQIAATNQAGAAAAERGMRAGTTPGSVSGNPYAQRGNDGTAQSIFQRAYANIGQQQTNADLALSQANANQLLQATGIEGELAKIGPEAQAAYANAVANLYRGQAGLLSPLTSALAQLYKPQTKTKSVSSSVQYHQPSEGSSFV
jgi:hypothetical protein